MGGNVDRPTYAQVKKGDTGHLETTEVTYDSSETNFQQLVQFFFEIHDFSQEDGQGPDIGSQYLSAVFVGNERERQITNATIEILRGKGYQVVTKILPVTTFWKAESYHQNYYAERSESSPYCHAFHQIF
jgi:peptide methionine sulfoxide reductase msrA/msrB